MRIGIICPSEIALRRFMPALESCECFEFAGIGMASPEEWFGPGVGKVPEGEIVQQQNREREKADVFVKQFGGRRFDSYAELLSSPEVEAAYIPLPPGLHSRWAEAALKAGKHVLVEKPATTSLADTRSLIELAGSRGLALHENYMFIYHSQLDEIEKIIASGEIGEIRLIRISFGFPRRAANDFRYNKALGGGALLDCGGYTIRYASRLLGSSARLIAAQSNYIEGFDVDMFGSASMVNDAGVTAQLAFGMDNNYKCDLEVWGSLGTLFTGRVLTAPAGFAPEIVIRKGNDIEKRPLPADDTFRKSLLHFKDCIDNETVRKEQYHLIENQAELVDQFIHFQLSGRVIVPV